MRTAVALALALCLAATAAGAEGGGGGGLCTLAGGTATMYLAQGQPSTYNYVIEEGGSNAAAGIVPGTTQSGTSLVGKAAQGNLYSAYAVNTTTTAAYLVCINAASVPAANAAITPVDVATLAGQVGATAQVNYGPGPPNAYSAGVTCVVTTLLTSYAAGGAAFMQTRVR